MPFKGGGDPVYGEAKLGKVFSGFELCRSSAFMAGGWGMFALNVKDAIALTIQALWGYFKEFNAKGRGKVAHGSLIFCSYLF